MDEGRTCYSHHASDPLADGHRHDPFDVYRILEHGGDMNAAIGAAAAELGGVGGQGLLSRCLVVWPESTIGRRPYKAVNLAETPAMRRYFGRLLEILEAELPLVEETRNQLDPRLLPLNPAAKPLWIGFHDHVETLCAEGRELAPIKGLAAKAAEHAARLAGTLLTLIGNLEAGAINRNDIEAGIVLVEHYLSEALRLFDASGENPDLILAEKCLAWGRGRPGGRFAAVELYQRGPNAIRDKATAERILKILVEHGLARSLPEGTEIDGKRRKNAWEVRPA